MLSGLSLFDVAGFIGVIVYLGSYAALQLGLLNGQGYRYALLNTLAAGCVLISLLHAFNLSSALIQISWIAISVVGMARFYFLTHRVRFTEEETTFLDNVLPGLPRIKARKLLDLALWISGESGTVLTVEGKRPPHLVFLVSGEAEVLSNGEVIALCQPNSFVGEMTVMSDEVATATVSLTQASRYLSIAAEELRALVRRDVDVRVHLENCFAHQVKQKLVASNRARVGVDAA